MSITPQIPPITKLEEKNIMDLLLQDKRIDGRELSEHRKLDIKVGIIGKANGSAEVSLGKTKVIVGVKVEVEKPYPDTPNQGTMSVNAELNPLASPTYEAGPPNEHSIELARVVDRSIRESKTIDLEKLCIEPAKKTFTVFIDIDVMDQDGNLIDASTLASVAALLSAKMFDYELKNDKVIYKSKQKPLPITDCPIAVTFAKLGDKLVVDPCLKEEGVMTSRLTIGVNKKGAISAVQKGGNGGFKIDEINKAADMAIEKSKELRAKVLEVVKNA